MTRWWIYLEIVQCLRLYGCTAVRVLMNFYNVPQLFCVNASFYGLKMYKCSLLMMVVLLVLFCYAMHWKVRGWWWWWCPFRRWQRERSAFHSDIYVCWAFCNDMRTMRLRMCSRQASRQRVIVGVWVCTSMSTYRACMLRSMLRHYRFSSTATMGNSRSILKRPARWLASIHGQF